jgi:hypothetical protein
VVSVTVADDVRPVTVLEKVKLVGLTASGATPVPVSFTMNIHSLALAPCL